MHCDHSCVSHVLSLRLIKLMTLVCFENHLLYRKIKDTWHSTCFHCLISYVFPFSIRIIMIGVWELSNQSWLWLGLWRERNAADLRKRYASIWCQWVMLMSTLISQVLEMGTMCAFMWLVVLANREFIIAFTLLHPRCHFLPRCWCGHWGTSTCLR